MDTAGEELEKLKEPEPHSCILESYKVYLQSLASFPVKLDAPEYSTERVTEMYPDDDFVCNLNQSTSELDSTLKCNALKRDGITLLS